MGAQGDLVEQILGGGDAADSDQDHVRVASFGKVAQNQVRPVLHRRSGEAPLLFPVRGSSRDIFTGDRGVGGDDAVDFASLRALYKPIKCVVPQAGSTLEER